jgi:hypothetical protein
VVLFRRLHFSLGGHTVLFLDVGEQLGVRQLVGNSLPTSITISLGSQAGDGSEDSVEVPGRQTRLGCKLLEAQDTTSSSLSLDLHNLSSRVFLDLDVVVLYGGNSCLSGGLGNVSTGALNESSVLRLASVTAVSLLLLLLEGGNGSSSLGNVTGRNGSSSGSVGLHKDRLGHGGVRGGGGVCKGRRGSDVKAQAGIDIIHCFVNHRGLHFVCLEDDWRGGGCWGEFWRDDLSVSLRGDGKDGKRSQNGGDDLLFAETGVGSYNRNFWNDMGRLYKPPDLTLTNALLVHVSLFGIFRFVLAFMHSKGYFIKTQICQGDRSSA